MRKLRIAMNAVEDLEAIRDYLHGKSPQAALHVTRSLVAGFEILAETPWLGHQRDDVDDPRMRFYTRANYVIAYEFDDAVVDILHVVHGSRDFTRIEWR